MKRTANQRRADRKRLGEYKARNREFEALFGFERDFPRGRLLTCRKINQCAYRRGSLALHEGTTR